MTEELPIAYKLRHGIFESTEEVNQTMHDAADLIEKLTESLEVLANQTEEIQKDRGQDADVRNALIDARAALELAKKA